MQARFGNHMIFGLTHREYRQRQAQRDVRYTKIKRGRPQAVVGRDIPRCQRTACNCEVAGKFVEPHGEAAFRWAGKINFHHHGHRPGKALADAE